MNLFDSLPQPHKGYHREEEKRLAALIQTGNADALNELVMHNMREAMLYTRTVARTLDDGTLMSLCYETLVKNARRFDPSRQRFFAFAKAGLRGALYRRYNKETPKLPLEDDGFRPYNYGKVPVRGPDCDAATSGDHPPNQYDSMRDSEVVEPDFQTIFTRDRWATVGPVIKSRCSEQEQMVLTLTYKSGFNFQEQGKLLGVSRSAVHRTHVRALKKIRAELGRRKQLFNV